MNTLCSTLVFFIFCGCVIASEVSTKGESRDTPIQSFVDGKFQSTYLDDLKHRFAVLLLQKEPLLIDVDFLSAECNKLKTKLQQDSLFQGTATREQLSNLNELSQQIDAVRKLLKDNYLPSKDREWLKLANAVTPLPVPRSILLEKSVSANIEWQAIDKTQQEIKNRQNEAIRNNERVKDQRRAIEQRSARFGRPLAASNKESIDSNAEPATRDALNEALLSGDWEKAKRVIYAIQKSSETTYPNMREQLFRQKYETPTFHKLIVVPFFRIPTETEAQSETVANFCLLGGIDFGLTKTDFLKKNLSILQKEHPQDYEKGKLLFQQSFFLKPASLRDGIFGIGTDESSSKKPPQP